MTKVLRIISVVVIILIVAMGIIFLLGDEVLQMYDGGELSESNSNPESAREIGDMDGDNLEEATEDIYGITEGGGSNTDGGNSEEAIDGVNCKMQQIQYSLKNFKNSVECTNTGANGCISLVVNCSMEVYNLDREVDGIFGIRYSLVNSENEELDFELVQKNVGFDAPEFFSAEFIRSDISGVDEDSTCPFTMETIPRKEICS